MAVAGSFLVRRVNITWGRFARRRAPHSKHCIRHICLLSSKSMQCYDSPPQQMPRLSESIEFNYMISISRQFVHEVHFWRLTCKLCFSCVQESACSCVFTRSCYRCRGPELAPAPLLADTRAALAPHNHHHWLRTLGLESRGHLSPGLRHARICPALALERARAGRQSRGVCCRVFIIMGGEG